MSSNTVCHTGGRTWSASCGFRVSGQRALTGDIRERLGGRQAALCMNRREFLVHSTRFKPGGAPKAEMASLKRMPRVSNSGSGQLLAANRNDHAAGDN